MLAPGLLVGAEIARERLVAPWHLRRRHDRRKGARRAVAARIAKCDRQRAVAAHGMAENGLPVAIDGKNSRDQLWQFFGDIAPHAVIARERFLGGIDIEARA